jgi:hypothetical protein
LLPGKCSPNPLANSATTERVLQILSAGYLQDKSLWYTVDAYAAMFDDSVNAANLTRKANGFTCLGLESLIDMCVRYQRNAIRRRVSSFCPIQEENFVVPPIAYPSEREKNSLRIKDTPLPEVNMGRPTALTFHQLTKLNRPMKIFVFPVDDALSAVFPYTGLD